MPRYFSSPWHRFRLLMLAVCAIGLAGCDDPAASDRTSGSGNSPAGEASTDKTIADTTPDGTALPPRADNPPQRTFPPRSDTRFDRARAHIVARRYQAGRTILELLVADYPQYGRAEFYLALACHKLQDREVARGHFENVLAFKGHFQELDKTNYFYGWCLYYLGELPKARGAFETFLQSHPQDADAHFGIGLIDLDEDKLADAEARFHQALEHIAVLITNNPDQRERWLQEVSKFRARLSDVYVRQNKLEKARDELIQATSLYRDHYTAHFKLYRVLTRLGDDDGAAEAMKQYRLAMKRVRPELLDPE